MYIEKHTIFENARILGVQFAVAPGDSDTDSGICADSDNQLSPRRSSTAVQPSASDENKTKIRSQAGDPISNKDYLTPNSARRLFGNNADGATSCLPRRLPQRPRVNTVGSQGNRSGKQFRVRFADQVCSSAGSSSSSCTSENTAEMGATATAPIYSGYYTDGATSSAIHDRRPLSNANESEFNSGLCSCHYPLSSTRFSGYIPRQGNGGAFSLNDVESSVPGPPSYALAMTRIRRNDHQRFSRINAPPRVIRHYQNRSSSLPRGLHHSEYDDSRRSSFDCFEQSQCLDFKIPDKSAVDSILARSIENLCVTESSMRTNFGVRPGSGRRLPEAPVAANVPPSGAIRQPALSRQRRVRRTQAGGFRSQSVGRLPRDVLHRSNEHLECFAPNFYRMNLPAVRAQLIALDHRGFRTVLIEKLQPGPFGFYIATGMLNQKRGIFISRVSIPSLAPVLSVGDEILYVEDELIKGRSLEYVQSLIAGKTSVTIVLLPSVGPALC
ncbi:unnamed protein product [Toxocara canis]|uniref:PDZ domain-containing protein n=1 Tax=Toxocara canis TaxID=6265 RepID=A0A183UGA6_TOXCA|nr:unnamed protein product [Toxocara canis]